MQFFIEQPNYLSDSHDFLVLCVRSDDLYAFEQVGVVVPEGVRVVIHADLVDGELVGLGQLLSEGRQVCEDRCRMTLS